MGHIHCWGLDNSELSPTDLFKLSLPQPPWVSRLTWRVERLQCIRHLAIDLIRYVDPLVQFWWIPARSKLHQRDCNWMIKLQMGYIQDDVASITFAYGSIFSHALCIHFFHWKKDEKTLCFVFVAFPSALSMSVGCRIVGKSRLDWLGRDLRRLSYRKSKEILSILWTIATGGHVACVPVWHACLTIETCRTLGHFRTLLAPCQKTNNTTFPASNSGRLSSIHVDHWPCLQKCPPIEVLTFTSLHAESINCLSYG